MSITKEREQEKLVEALKGPHFYKFMISGYGADTLYYKISKECYDFWYNHNQEYGDSDIVTYIYEAENYTKKELVDEAVKGELFDDFKPEELSKEQLNKILFLHDPEDEETVGSQRFDALCLMEETWGPDYSDAFVTVDKVESNEWQALSVDDYPVIDQVSPNDLTSQILEKNDELETCVYLNELEYPREMNYTKEGDHILQVVISEKGVFFEATEELQTLFDIEKLKFITDEAPDGSDVVFGLVYDGKEIDNNGGDTRGKGESVYFWKG